MRFNDASAERFPPRSYTFDADGLVGSHLLSLFTVDLDYAHSRIYLTPSVGAKRRQEAADLDEWGAMRVMLAFLFLLCANAAPGPTSAQSVPAAKDILAHASDNAGPFRITIAKRSLALVRSE